MENIQREQLNKVEEAEGVEQLAKELKLTTNAGIAEEIGMSDKWVSVRRRILTLPKKVQDAIARDAVPIEAVSLLKKAADASPRRPRPRWLASAISRVGTIRHACIRVWDTGRQ